MFQLHVWYSFVFSFHLCAHQLLDFLPALVWLGHSNDAFYTCSQLFPRNAPGYNQTVQPPAPPAPSSHTNWERQRKDFDFHSCRLVAVFSPSCFLVGVRGILVGSQYFCHESTIISVPGSSQIYMHVKPGCYYNLSKIFVEVHKTTLKCMGRGKENRLLKKGKE